MTTTTTRIFASLTALAFAAPLALTGCSGAANSRFYPAAPSGVSHEEADSDSGHSAKSSPPAPPTGATPTDQGGASESRPAPRAQDAKDPFSLQKPKKRPGLATQFGEQRFSRVTSAPFVRANRLRPFALGKLFYNDRQGVSQMASGARDHMSRFSVGGGHVDVGLKSANGNFLSGFVASNSNYVIGNSGQRYTIFIRNHSPGRLEAVVSVDGLDVIDGKSGSLKKRGYLIDPHGTLEIDGWRTSTTKVAAFRFGSVSNSYTARKHGKTRNVGVIGVAMFHQRGDSPRMWNKRGNDAGTRQGANPFPQKFATPPK